MFVWLGLRWLWNEEDPVGKNIFGNNREGPNNIFSFKFRFNFLVIFIWYCCPPRWDYRLIRRLHYLNLQLDIRGDHYAGISLNLTATCFPKTQSHLVFSLVLLARFVLFYCIRLRGLPLNSNCNMKYLTTIISKVPRQSPSLVAFIL